MLHRMVLSEPQARAAIEKGEFDMEVLRSSENVAIVLTQGWCFEWVSMARWLDRMAKRREPVDIEIDVYELVYDRVDYFHDFLLFKETVFRNHRVPYVRYYVKGVLQSESNYVSAAEFLSHF